MLVEKPLAAADARQVVALDRGTERPPYFVLIPVEDAASRVEATIGTLATSEVLGTSSLYFGSDDLERIRQEVLESSRAALAASLDALRAAGVAADGEVTAIDPLDRLCELVAERRARKVVMLTRPHLVAELLHVDWTSRARKRLDVPCVHLLAHDDRDG